MKTLNEIYEELKEEADNKDCEQSLWATAEKIYQEQKVDTLYQIKDNYADTRCKYKEILTFITWQDIPKKYINSKISYRHSYYFTNKQDADKFADFLSNKYKRG